MGCWHVSPVEIGEVRAIDCVLEMAKTLRERKNKHDLLPCPVGFGLNDGKVLLGIPGSKERREFTVLGDVVNTAARLCGIVSPFQALMTEDMAEKHCCFYRNEHFKGKFATTGVYSLKS